MAYDESGHLQRDTGGAAEPVSRSSDWPRHASLEQPTDNPWAETTGGAHWSTVKSGEFPGPPLADPRATPKHRGIPASVLDDVFDDPAHGDPGRDRIAVHLLWEMLLLAGVVALVYLLYERQPQILDAVQLKPLLVTAVVLGLLTLGTGLSLRTGAVNLALGPVAIASALYFAEQGGRGAAALGPAVLAAAVVGLLLALVVVGLHVPGWAASLAVALVIVGFLVQRAPVPAPLRDLWYDPTRHAYYLFGGYAAITVIGGVLGTVKPIRRALGRFRPVGDPAQRRGGVAAALTATALVAATVYAMLAGALLAGSPAGPVGSDPIATGLAAFEWSGLALGAALLGGTSAFGRRGGVTGSLLAVVLLTLMPHWIGEQGWTVSRFTVAAAAIGLGLLATRLVESYGRPCSSVEADEDWGDGLTASVGWLTPDGRTGSWSSDAPPPPRPRRTDQWDTDG